MKTEIEKMKEELAKRNQLLMLTTNQYNSLLKKYNEVLQLAKENADSMEYCCQELENKLEEIHDTVIELSETYPECALICIKILNLINRSDTEGYKENEK